MFHLTSTTVLAWTSRSLLNAITTRLEHVRPHNHILFCLSQNANEEALSRIPSLWKDSIGCLSAPLPHLENHVVCSILQIPHAMGHPFVSNIPGRPPAQVGRYHSNHRSSAKDTYDQSVESFNRAMGQTAHRHVEHKLPEGLDPAQPYSLIYLSDPEYEGIADSLDFHFPNSSKVALLGSSTPFVTGHPVTLFHNGNVVSRGAVGIGITPPISNPLLEYEGLEPLSETMNVTSSQGNLIHTLDDANPSKLLTDAIKSTSSSSSSNSSTSNPKDDDFYLGLVSSSGNLDKIYTVISGDPSRGSLALEGEESPSKGSRVQLFRRSPITKLSNSQNYTELIKSMTSHSHSINLLTSSRDALWSAPSNDDNDATHVDELHGEDKVTILQDTFFAASENGFLVSRGGGGHNGEKTWRSSVEGGRISVGYPRAK